MASSGGVYGVEKREGVSGSVMGSVRQDTIARRWVRIGSARSLVVPHPGECMGWRRERVSLCL